MIERQSLQVGRIEVGNQVPVEIPRVARGVSYPVAREPGVVQQVDAEGGGDVDIHCAAVFHRLDPFLRRAKHLPVWNWHLEVMAPAPDGHFVDAMFLGVPGDAGQVLVPHGGELRHGFVGVGHPDGQIAQSLAYAFGNLVRRVHLVHVGAVGLNPLGPAAFVRGQNILRTFPGFPRPDAARLPAGEPEPVGLLLADVSEDVGTAVVTVAPLFLKQAEPAPQGPIVQPVHDIGAIGIGRGLVDVPAGVERPEGCVVTTFASLCERRHHASRHRQLGPTVCRPRAGQRNRGKKSAAEVGRTCFRSGNAAGQTGRPARQ